jgi:uncharacterized protein
MQLTNDVVKPEPLTDAELDRLNDILQRFGDERSMNLEQLDGFFAALVCGPELALPSEYLPEIWGRDLARQDGFMAEDLQEFLSLIFQHWNVVADTLNSGDVYLPLLLHDEDGVSRANDWARGFVRGMKVRPGDWSLLVDDEEHAGSLVPIFALAHENDPDPAMRPYKDPISAEQREQLIAGAAAGVMQIYRYFEAERLREMPTLENPTTFRRTMPKVGRNDPCPCGSSKKFKQCCGRSDVTLH